MSAEEGEVINGRNDSKLVSSSQQRRSNQNPSETPISFKFKHSESSNYCDPTTTQKSLENSNKEDTDELLQSWSAEGDICELGVQEVEVEIEEENNMSRNNHFLGSEGECDASGDESGEESRYQGTSPNANTNVNESSEDDLYGDLDVAVFSSPKKSKSLPREVLENRLEESLKEIVDLKERITSISRENLNLLSNFSSLLKTAREDKEKNIFTLRELRNQLKHVTTVNMQRSSLSKEEIEKIFAYCNQVENQLQSQVSLNVIREALDSAKTDAEKKKQAYKRKWSKQFKFENMSMYMCKEQINFGRLEEVTFPPRQLPVPLPVLAPSPSIPVSGSGSSSKIDNSSRKQDKNSDSKSSSKVPSSNPNPKFPKGDDRRYRRSDPVNDHHNHQSDKTKLPPPPRSSNSISASCWQEGNKNDLGQRKSREEGYHDRRKVSDSDRHDHHHQSAGTGHPQSHSSNPNINRNRNFSISNNGNEGRRSHSGRTRSRSRSRSLSVSQTRPANTPTNNIIDTVKVSSDSVNVNHNGQNRNTRRNQSSSRSSRARSRSPTQRRGSRIRKSTTYRR